MSLLIAYHKAPAGRAADLPGLLFGGEPLALVAEFCKAYDKIKNFRYSVCKTGTLLVSIPVRIKNLRLQQFST